MLQEELLKQTTKIVEEQKEQFKDDELALEKLNYIRSKTATFARELNNTFSSKSNNYSFEYGEASVHTVEEINEFLRDPSRYARELVEVSEYLYKVSGIYRRLIQNMATMHSLEYTVFPMTKLRNNSKLEQDKMQDSLYKTLAMLENMEIKDEMPRNWKIAYKRGIVYLFENESADSYYLQALPHNYCRVSSITDGVLNIDFNFEYFSGREGQLNEFSPYFTEVYNRYKQGNKSYYRDGWVALDPNKAFALKIDNEDLETILPPFASVFPDIKDLEQAKQRKKLQEQIENYLLLVQHIPVNDKSQTIDAFKISFDMAMFYHQQALATLPKEIGILTTPMEITSIKTQKPHNSEDTVANKTKTLFDNASVSQFLFNSDKATGVAVANSLRSLEQLVFYAGRQFERFVNRKLKTKRWSYRFKFKLLDITAFNRDDVTKKYLEGGNSGFPTTLSYSSAIGMSPLQFVNSLELENDVLDFQSKMMPWKSAHTMSNSDKEIKESGREELPVDEITESTENWRESDSSVEK